MAKKYNSLGNVNPVWVEEDMRSKLADNMAEAIKSALKISLYEAIQTAYQTEYATLQAKYDFAKNNGMDAISMCVINSK